MAGPKKEVCRHYQRGSCQFGNRCKFLHSTPPNQQQQFKPNNPFGFGNQQQKQTPNPFGFGTQAGNSQPKVLNNNNNNNNNAFKPFENKWSRFSNNNNGGSQASRQPDNQPVTANHKCTDSDSCKRLIVEDFEHERPLWKLTSYGHNKSAPCDIVGDMSCEELRAAAYNDASHGLTLQSIVERERSLLNAKLQEFESLLRNPYVPKDTSVSTQNSSHGFGPSVLPATTPNNIPQSVSSFSQFGGSPNLSFGIRPAISQNNAFGQQISTQVPSQANSGFGTNTLPFGNAGAALSGLFGVQHPNQQMGNTGASFSGSAITIGQNISSFLQASSQGAALGSTQSPMFPKSPSSTAATVDSKPRENEAVDDKIWLVEWKRGAVPEEAPPDNYIS